MTKEEAIKTIMTHVEHWHRLLRDKICDETEGKETIEAFLMAIEALDWKQNLTDKLHQLEMFNNNDVPEWVWKVIEGM